MVRPITRDAARFVRQAEAEEARAAMRLPSRTCLSHPVDVSSPLVDRNGSNLLHRGVYAPIVQQVELSKAQMISNGWCPHQVNHLSRIYNIKSFTYLAKLKRSIHRLVDHKHCINPTACTAYNTNPSTYKTRHTTEDCTCEMVNTPYKKLVKVIRHGGIPLLSIEQYGGTSTLHTLEVHSRSRTSTYIAISHVWADGLGNPRSNGLPLCQIKRLNANLMALTDMFNTGKKSVLFWMDTLCIPVGTDDRPLRLIQIDKMASIYKGAITSLVLDAELMATMPNTRRVVPKASEGQTNGNPRGVEGLDLETRARLACCVWMCRSWTLQEGELPATITVQFLNNAVVLGRASSSDGLYRERFTSGPVLPEGDREEVSEAGETSVDGTELVRLDNMSSSTEKKTVSSTPRCDCVDIKLQRMFYTAFFKERKDFATIWNELAGRSTTMADDIPLIMTNILELENSGLLAYHSTGNMFQAIMLSLKRLPLSIFFNTGRRQIGTSLNRWVPVKISKDILAPDDSLIVQSSHFLYQHNPLHTGLKHSVYMINAVLSMDSRVHLHCEGEEIIYTVEDASEHLSDQLLVGDFDSTCFIVENENANSTVCSGVKRGACFCFRKGHKFGPDWFLPSPSVGSRMHEIPTADMTFICPVRFQQFSNSECLGVGQHDVYPLDLIRHRFAFRINYDPIPDFKRLKKREKRFLPRLCTHGKGPAWATMFGLLMLGGSFVGGAQLPIESPLLHFWAITGIYFAGCGIFVLIGWLLKQIAAWRYVRAYGAIAASRPPGGTV